MSDNGTLVGTGTSTAAYPGEILSFSLVTNPNGIFAVNYSDVQITVANGSLLHYEAGSSASISVRVTDHAGLTFDKAFTIAVTNVVGVTLTGTDPSSGSSSYAPLTRPLVTQPATTGTDRTSSRRSSADAAGARPRAPRRPAGALSSSAAGPVRRAARRPRARCAGGSAGPSRPGGSP